VVGAGPAGATTAYYLATGAGPGGGKRVALLEKAAFPRDKYCGDAWCAPALDILEDEPQLVERLWENTRFFKAGLEALGFNTGASESPITPVIVGDAARAMTLSDRLFDKGVFAQGIGFPTVPLDKARVRTIVTATHTREELQFALDAFKAVGTALGVI